MTGTIGKGLVRTKGGAVLHRDTCPRVVMAVTSSARPWAWADDVPWGSVTYAVTTGAIRVCKVCRPLEGRTP